MKPVLPVRVHKSLKPKHGASGAGKTIPAAKVLKEFGIPAPEKTHQMAEMLAPKIRTSAAGGTPSVLEDVHARGVQEGREQALAEAQAKLEEQQQFYEKQLELERCTWVAREAEALAAQLSAGLEQVKTAIASQTARILKPFLAGEVQRQAVNELLQALDAVLTADHGLNIEVSGPEDLLQLLREKLAERHVAAEFSPAASADLRVTVGQTILETRLAAWLAKLKEIAK